MVVAVSSKRQAGTRIACRENPLHCRLRSKTVVEEQATRLAAKPRCQGRRFPVASCDWLARREAGGSGQVGSRGVADLGAFLVVCFARARALSLSLPPPFSPTRSLALSLSLCLSLSFALTPWFLSATFTSAVYMA